LAGHLPTGFDRAIADYYNRWPEEGRLQLGPFQLEEARTRELIERFVPSPPATVVDVGGAAGAYALWLAERGYAVHLIDAVPRLVAEAERRSAAAPESLASCQVGDAGFDLRGVYGLEGPGWILPDVAGRVAILGSAMHCYGWREWWRPSPRCWG
jgi:SAM-dependent methyltransferase